MSLIHVMRCWILFADVLLMTFSARVRYGSFLFSVAPSVWLFQECRVPVTVECARRVVSEEIAGNAVTAS